jgi:small subunit ribosomal protein S6
MAQVLNNYEMLLITHQTINDETITASFDNLSKVITESGGNLISRDDWGRVRMAYPINKQRFAKYFLLEYVAPSTVPLELERMVRFDDKTYLRFLTVRLGENVSDLDGLKEAAEARKTKRQEQVAAMKQEKRDRR